LSALNGLRLNHENELVIPRGGEGGYPIVVGPNFLMNDYSIKDSNNVAGNAMGDRASTERNVVGQTAVPATNDSAKEAAQINREGTIAAAKTQRTGTILAAVIGLLSAVGVAYFVYQTGKNNGTQQQPQSKGTPKTGLKVSQPK
jgi:hypothetical protein